MRRILIAIHELFILIMESVDREWMSDQMRGGEEGKGEWCSGW